MCDAGFRIPGRAGGRALHAVLPFLLLVLAACNSAGSHRLMARSIAPASQAEVAAVHRIFITTTRDATKAPGVFFSGERAQSLSFAGAEISVPSVHETGKIERSPATEFADPARYLAARQVQLFPEEEAFRRELARDIAGRDGRALVFVHGFNTDFAAAVYRMTQIVHDSGYRGTPVLFTWPSSARLYDYLYDYNSASAARDALERTIRLVAEAGARRVDVVAHSMGSWVTMEALRQLAMTGRKDLGGRLGEVVLASPDLDVDVFKTQMRRYGDPAGNFFVLTSSDDRALSLSQFIAGNRPRLGDYTEASDLTQYGVTVVDLSAVTSGDRLNHTKFAENPLLIRLLGESLAVEDDLPPGTELSQRVSNLTRGIGQTLGSTAEIIISTPFEVLDVVIGGDDD